MKTNLTRKNYLKRPLPQQPLLRFSPTAWGKLLYLRDAGPTEIGGFGISRVADPLFVTDLVLIQQTCTGVSVVFDDQAVTEYFDQQVDQGLRPTEFARIWIHTHPGNSAEPKPVRRGDLGARVRGHRLGCDVYPGLWWAVLLPLEFHVGPGAAVELANQVDYRQPFAASDHRSWLAEYRARVQPLVSTAEVKELADTDWLAAEGGRDEAFTLAREVNEAEAVDDWDPEQGWEEYLSTSEDYIDGN